MINQIIRLIEKHVYQILDGKTHTKKINVSMIDLPEISNPYCRQPCAIIYSWTEEFDQTVLFTVYCALIGTRQHDYINVTSIKLTMDIVGDDVHSFMIYDKNPPQSTSTYNLFANEHAFEFLVKYINSVGILNEDLGYMGVNFDIYPTNYQPSGHINVVSVRDIICDTLSYELISDSKLDNLLLSMSRCSDFEHYSY